MTIGWAFNGIFAFYMVIELSFRYLFQHIAVKSTGTALFSGPVDKQLSAYESISVTIFQLMNCNIPILTIQNPKGFSKNKNK